MASNLEDKSRDIKKRHLKVATPKPNVVRIELLSQDARARYLGKIQQMGDEARGFATESINKIQMLKNRVFYGILKNGYDDGMSMGADWTDSKEMAKLWEASKKVGASAVSAIGKAVGGIAGGAFADKATGAIGDAVDVASELMAISSDSTGSASVQKFSGVKLNEYTVSVGWYLPEQYDLCKHSMRILYQMIYPMQASFSNLGTKLSGSNFTELNDRLDNALASSTQSKDLNLDADSSQATGIISQLFTGIADIASTAVSGLAVGAVEAYGQNLTFDPLPVRLCVGHIIDLEPLVITGVKTSLSPELYITADGKHLPIFVSASISFKMWLKPRPDQQWFKFLGEEMFANDIGGDDKYQLPDMAKHIIM